MCPQTSEPIPHLSPRTQNSPNDSPDPFCPNLTTTDDAPLPEKVPFEERLKNSPSLKKTYDSMPEHLHGLFMKSIVHLYNDQAIAVGELLSEFADVFAKDDFDIGCSMEVLYMILIQVIQLLSKLE